MVTRDEAAQLAEGNPFSFLHVVRSEIDLPPSTDPHDPEVYQKAKHSFDLLLKDSFVQDARPCVYLYEMTLEGHTQLGIVGCMHVDSYERNEIRRHEITRKDKEDDRTRHILTLNAHPEPVLLAYPPSVFLSQLNAKITETMPLFDYTSAGVRHRGWKVDQRPDQYIDGFRRIGHGYIADGHHRTAGAWRAAQELKAANPDHTGDEEYNWFLAVLFPANQLRILPYHRVVRDLNGMTPESLVSRLAQHGEIVPATAPVPSAPGSFGVLLGEQWFRYSLPAETVMRAEVAGTSDAVLLQSEILEPLLGIGDIRSDPRIGFVGGLDAVQRMERMVLAGEMAVGFALRPTQMDEVMRVSDAGQVMPPKSTWFEPKLQSGLFVHTLS